jgi:hypothetical protein
VKSPYSTDDLAAASPTASLRPIIIHRSGDRLVGRHVDVLSSNCHSPLTSWTWLEAQENAG